MKVLGFLFLLLLLVVGAGAYVLYTPYGPQQETFVDIPSGTSSQAMAKQLEQAGIIRSQYAFDLLRIVRKTRLKAGEYRFDHPAKVSEVYDRIARGDVYTRSVTIPEGFNLYDIAAAVEAAGLGSAADFLAAARSNTALIAQWNPHATSLEGYLFPDTYRFSRHTTPQMMLQTMVHRFAKALQQLQVPAGTDVPRLVTMASLVEKEVRVDAERPMVAGVFENRLRTGMPLATDPTVIYAAILDGRWNGVIHQSDLHNPSPYNTYVHAGLPPGPICSPGIAAFQAALHPAETQNMYFVADAAGHTNFSATLKEHDTQVKAYRKAAR